MIIGLCTIELRLPMSHSLKNKRGIIKSIMAKLKNQFNIAVAEVDKNDHHKLATIGVVTISNQSRHVEQILSKAVDFVEEKFREVQLMDYSIQFI